MSDDLITVTADLLERLREKRPAVHCLTNTVAEPITANALLAIGAIPSLTSDAEEVGEFVRSADGLLINLGTPNTQMRDARRMATDIATQKSIPWVLDPVMVDRSSIRREEALDFVTTGPTAIRCNAAEAKALKLHESGFSGILAQTGEIDEVRSRDRAQNLRTGHPLMTQVTAAGCALSAVVAAFLATSPDTPFEASVAALLVFGTAGALAGADTKGPGSFAAGLLDQHHAINATTLREQTASVMETA